jgi:hypothetical protein
LRLGDQCFVWKEIFGAGGEKKRAGFQREFVREEFQEGVS